MLRFKFPNTFREIIATPDGLKIGVVVQCREITKTGGDRSAEILHYPVRGSVALERLGCRKRLLAQTHNRSFNRMKAGWPEKFLNSRQLATP